VISPHVIFDSYLKIGKYSSRDGEYFRNKAEIFYDSLV
jgi:hypothetical protein